jgi:hypothetical protein
VAVPPGHQPTPPSWPPGGYRPRGGGATQAALRARFRLLFFTNFFTFANVLTPPSVHELGMCVSFSQTFPKGLVTSFTTLLDPNTYAKLDRSSGTR